MLAAGGLGSLVLTMPWLMVGWIILGLPRGSGITGWRSVRLEMSSKSCVSTVAVLPTAGVGSASARRSLGAASAAAGPAGLMFFAVVVASATGDRSPETALPDRCGPHSAVDAGVGPALDCEDVVVAGRSLDERLNVSSV